MVVVVVVEVVEVVDGSGGGRFAGFMTVYEKESYRKAKDKWQHDIPRAFPMSNVHLSSYLILSPRCSRVYRPIHPQMPPMHWSLYFTKYRRSKRVHFTSFSALWSITLMGTKFEITTLWPFLPGRIVACVSWPQALHPGTRSFSFFQRIRPSRRWSWRFYLALCTPGVWDLQHWRLQPGRSMRRCYIRHLVESLQYVACMVCWSSWMVAGCRKIRWSEGRCHMGTGWVCLLRGEVGRRYCMLVHFAFLECKYQWSIFHAVDFWFLLGMFSQDCAFTHMPCRR